MSTVGITDGRQLQCVALNDSGGLNECAFAKHARAGMTGLDVGVLLLDTPADTIGIRPVPGHCRSWSGWRTQRAIITQARRLDPAAEVDLLPQAEGRKAVVVLNRQVPDDWLDTLSASNGVRFRQVVSATRAIARYGPQGDACCLYVVRRGLRVRHLLCRDRVACFTREVVCEDLESALAALDETLEYLSARNTLTENTLLAHGALLVGEREHLVKHPAFVDQLPLASEAADAAVQDVYAATAVRGIAAMLSGRSKRWQVDVRDPGLPPRDPWLADQRDRQRLRLYRCGVGGAVTLVLLTGGVTVLQTVEVWQQWQQQQNETARLAAAVVELQAAARDLHPHPAQAASLLEARHRLRAGTRTGSLWIPALLATVLSRFDAIALQQVSWHGGSRARLSDDALDQARWQVHARDSVPMADSPAMHWQLRIAGQLDRRLSRREQQAHFDAFVADLRAQPEVRQLSIGQSPVEAWRFSPTAASSFASPFASSDAAGEIDMPGDVALRHDPDRVAAEALMFDLSMQVAATDHD